MIFTTNQIGLKASYGCISMNTGGWTGISFAFTTAYQELAGLATAYTLVSPSKDFAMTTDGRLKYTGTTTKTFNVDAQFTTTSSANFAIQLYKNGVALSGSESYQAGSFRTLLSRFPIDLSVNDYLSIYGKISSSASASILNITLSATFAGGL